MIANVEVPGKQRIPRIGWWLVGERRAVAATPKPKPHITLRARFRSRWGWFTTISGRSGRKRYTEVSS